jgi:hypothetical protein
METNKYRLLYFIPPELRKHVKFVKGLPKIIADTITNPNTYATLNQVLNPVEWVIAPVRNTRKFIDSGYKDMGALTNATIETLGLAAGPVAQKYASTLSPIASKGVSSGVKSLQELVMPLGASDDVAEEVSKRTGINRRQFIAGTAALGAASGLKGVGDIFPTSKVIKATAKSPIFSTVVDLNKLRGQFKAKALRYDDILQTSKDIELNEEIGSLPSSMKKYDNDLFKFEEDALAKQEELMDVVNTIEAELMELTDNIVAEGIEGVSKLNEGELVNLRRTFTDEYNVYTRVGDFDHRISAPKNLEAEKIINKALENKGLMNLDDFRKSRLTVKNRKEAGELGIAGDYEYDFYGNLTDDKLSVVDDFHSSLKKDFNKGGTPMNRNNYRIELVSDLEDAPKFNKGGLYQEGGMQDDGMDRDPVSGNEIPPGSLAKEVRDDIPAQLSEGEYVVPADVVQYYGLKFFEDLRDKAKMALARMERDGRIGGEPVDTEPQMDTGDFPFSVDELQTFSEGGTPRGYQPGGGVTFVGTPTTTMQPNPLTYVSPVMATPQMNQTSNFGTGVSGGVYTSGVTVPTGMTMPSVSSSIKTERYINDKCSELTLLEGQGAPAGYVLASSPQGIEYSKACFPERYPDDQQDTSTEDDTQTTAEPEDTQVAQAEQDDNENKRQGNDVSYANASSDVFFEGEGENFVAKVGGRDGYAGDGQGPAKNWTYDDYSEYLRNLESGVGNIYGSIPIVSNLVKKRHKEVLESAKERLTSGLNSDGKTLSVNERIVLENVLLHKELGGLGALFNLAKDEEIGNINDLIELDKEIQTADGVTYTIKYVGVNAKGADKYGYIRIINGKQVDSSKLSSVLSDASSRSVYQDGAKYDSNALRDFLATGVSTVTDLAGNQHLARIRGDYYSVGGILTPIKDIMEEIGDPELAMKLANNPSLLLGYLPPALRSDGKVPEEQEPGYQKPNFKIKPGIDQGGFVRPDQTDPFSGSFTPDLFDPAYDDIEKTNIPPTSIETSSVTADTTPPTTQLASAGFGTSSLQQTADIVENISQQDDETLDAMGDIDDTPGYEKTSSDVLVEQQKAREKQAQDNEDRRQARQEAKVSQAFGGGQAAEKFTASQDDDDDDAVSKGQQQGKGYTGGFGFRKGGMPKQTIQMERVKI